MRAIGPVAHTDPASAFSPTGTTAITATPRSSGQVMLFVTPVNGTSVVLVPQHTPCYVRVTAQGNSRLALIRSNTRVPATAFGGQNVFAAAKVEQ